MTPLQPKWIEDFTQIIDKLIDTERFNAKQVYKEHPLTVQEFAQALNLCLNQEQPNVELGYTILEGAGFQYHEILPYLVWHMIAYGMKVKREITKFRNDNDIIFEEYKRSTLRYKIFKNQPITSYSSDSVWEEQNPYEGTVVLNLVFFDSCQHTRTTNNKVARMHRSIIEHATLYAAGIHRSSNLETNYSEEIDPHGDMVYILKRAKVKCNKLDTFIYMNGTKKPD